MCSKVMLIVGGRIEFFRKIKECKDEESVVPSNFKLALELRQSIKELKNAYGDSILTKDVSNENPYRLGEENVLLGIANPFTLVTRGFVTILEFDLDAFFKLI